MNVWLTILGMLAATYFSRALPLLTLRGEINPTVVRFMRYVPPAIFAALILPMLFVPNDKLSFGPDLWAGLVGIAVAWRTRNMAITIVVGMAVYWLLRWLGLH